MKPLTDALVLILGLLGFLALISWSQEQDAKDMEAYRSALLAKCENNTPHENCELLLSTR